MQIALLGQIEREWREPDAGIWEVRGPPQQFTYSKVMAWVAFDRAIKIRRGSAWSATSRRRFRMSR
jgi:GH15 family glucan-1,4-alpha-glucosidase